MSALEPDQFACEADEPHTIVIDLREADERVAAGSIAGSIPLPRGLLELRADPDSDAHDPRLRPGGRVLLYCSDGSRSMLAVRSLRGLVYTDVAHLEGGLIAWTAALMPLVGRFPVPY